MDLKDPQRHWHEFGCRDPLWTILMSPGKRNSRWKTDDFFRTGREEVARVLAHVDRLGLVILALAMLGWRAAAVGRDGAAASGPRPMKLIALGLALLLGIALGFVLPPYPQERGAKDFIKYWAGSHRLAHGQSPYDIAALRATEIEASPENAPAARDGVQTWNPPWLLVALLPYGLMPFGLAASFWMFTNVCLLVLGLYLAWQMLGSPSDLVGFSCVLGAAFLYCNTILMLGIGQISSILLVGVVLTAWWLQRGRDRLAGMAILMLTIKPHVTYLVLLTVFLWMLRRRRWQVAVGTAVGAVATGVVTSVLYPDWFAAYLHNVEGLPYGRLYMSTLGSVLYWHLGFPAWIQFVGLACLPLAWPLSRRLDADRWLPTFNLALMTSVFVSPYGFSFDHVVLLPAVAEWIGWLRRGELPAVWRWITGMGIGVMYVALLALMFVRLRYTWRGLPTLLLVIAYLLAWRVRAAERHPA